MSSNQQPGIAGKLSGRGFLIGIGLFFGTVFLANGIMVYYALSTFDGVETDNAYRKGRAYNHVLEADAAQTALGWQVAIETAPTYTQDRIFLDVTVSMTDNKGDALHLASLPLAFWRPTVEGMDATTTLTPRGDGRYTGQIVLAGAGNWIARINTATSSGQPFVYEERLFIPPATEQSTQ